MRAKRKTVAEKRAEREQAERRDRNYFFPRLDSLQSALDLLKFMEQHPRGGGLFSNLAFFAIHTKFAVPDGSTDEERRHYIRFVERLAESGEVPRD